MLFSRKARQNARQRPDDIQQAQASRAADAQKLAELEAQSRYVERLSDRMAAITAAREFDDFGDNLEQSFTRRGGHV